MSKKDKPKFKYVGFLWLKDGKTCVPLFAKTLEEIQHSIDIEINQDKTELNENSVPWAMVCEVKKEFKVVQSFRLDLQIEKE